MGAKFARAFGAHVIVFTTSNKKKEDALRLGADEIVVSRSSDEMKKARQSEGPHFHEEEEETDVFDQFIRSGQLQVRLLAVD
jgi:D-arabinose 1-dehydrogenase-like Zn-dependent alcohol dehydrogenase